MEDQLSAVGIVMIVIFVFAFIALVFGIIVFGFKKKMDVVKKTVVDWNAKEIHVPLIASFLSIKGLPSFIALAYNNAFPKLIFFENDMECGFLFGKRKSYSSIERVDVWSAPATKNLIFYFKDSIVLRIYNLLEESHLKNALHFLRGKGCFLSEKAEGAIR